MLVVLSYLAMIFGWHLDYKMTGTMGGFGPNTWLLFVPIYEELIFRGVLLRYFERHGKWMAILITSVLFGVWHVKNIFWSTPHDLMIQILYTTLIFGPVTCLLTQKTRMLWPAVVLHFANNFPFDRMWEYYL